MRLILLRHGNTFAPGDRVVWVGARSDPPLVAKGREQARAAGRAIREADLRPDIVLCGPLRRTRQMAEILTRSLQWSGPSPTHSDALREIDYGRWEGRSNEEIRTAFGSDALEGWQRRSLWPQGHGWKPGPRAILDAWQAMIDGIEARHGATATALIITSNGILRILAPRYGIAPDAAKVGTGRLCLIEGSPAGAPGGERALAWNVARLC